MWTKCTSAVHSRGVGGLFRRKWPGEGSRPSPQSPIGILGFPPPDAVIQRTRKTKAKLLKFNVLRFLPSVKSPHHQ